MRFSAVPRSAPQEQAADVIVHGQSTPVLIRPLSALEDTEVVAAAIRSAKAKSATPEPGNAIYDAAMMSEVVAMSYLDAESPVGARRPFFDGGAAQVLSEFDSDGLANLYERQRIWQEQCAPTYRHRTISELFDLAHAIGAETDDPKALSYYLTLRPSTRWLLLRTTAALYAASASSRSSRSSNESAAAESVAAEPPSATDTSHAAT